MAFTTINPVTPGEATKIAHYDAIFDNTIAIRDGELAMTGQVAGDIPYAISASHLGRHPLLHWVDPVLTVPAIGAAVTQEAAPVMGEIYADTTIRAWASFDYAASTFTIRSGVNIKPIGAGSTDTRRISTGLYEIHYVTPIGSAFYVVLVKPHHLTVARVKSSVKGTRTSNLVQVQLIEHASQNPVDSPFDLAIIGV